MGNRRCRRSDSFWRACFPSQQPSRRDGRVAEGARLESVFTRKGNVGSNPTLSAMLLKINKLLGILNRLSVASFVFGMTDMQFC